MARPVKRGLDYFPFDVINNTKIELIEAEFEATGFAIVVKLLQKIYGEEGYFCPWGDEVALLFAKNSGVALDKVIKIVNAAVKRGIFNKELFEKYEILTSEDIQERYVKAKRNGSSFINKDYLLIALPENNINAEETQVNTEETPVNSVKTPIKKRKENKSKENQNKEKESKENTVSQNTDFKEEVQEVVDRWNQLENYGIKSVIKTVTDPQRYSLVTDRIKDNGLDTVLSAIDNIKKSKFLQGDNERGWSITFDWFIQQPNFQKVAEGNYENTAVKNKPAVCNVFTNYDQRIYSEEEINEILKRKSRE